MTRNQIMMMVVVHLEADGLIVWDRWIIRIVWNLHAGVSESLRENPI
jgi:hypothetical protein